MTNRLTLRSLALAEASATAQPDVARVASEQGAGTAAAKAVPRLTSVGGALVCDEIGKVADTLLDLDVTDVVVGAWDRHRAIQSARASTRDAPGTEEIVPLATYTTTSKYAPRIDVVVDELTVTSIELEVRIDVTVRGALVVIANGEVRDIRSGSVEVAGTLTCEGVKLSRGSHTFELSELADERPRLQPV